MKIKYFENTLYIFVAFLIIFLLKANAFAQKSPYDWALIQLDYARNEKIVQLDQFIKKVHTTARKASRDDKLISFFEVNRNYYNLSKTSSGPEELKKDIQMMRAVFDDYYISDYFIFYDILFVNNDGHVFYTVRKEKDLNINLIDNQKYAGMLGNVLSKKPQQEVFVDFYNYKPSLEPAAFFIEPVKKNGKQVGWIMLQCSVNKLNSIFTSTDALGLTGETFLVNHDGLMLTDSYFKGYSSILKQHLDDRNIKAKFKERMGHRVVTDYRGTVALSSFEVYQFLGTRWLVVAKIDKDEIITRHYQNHSKYYFSRFVDYIAKNPISSPSQSGIKKLPDAFRVDMDEFIKADGDMTLETWGVSTCTALVATIPGQFSYMAHISPRDKVYNNDETNLLGQILKRIKGFDIYASEAKKVEFIIIAKHLDSINNIIDLIVKDGFALSQIRLAYMPNAKSAAVSNNFKKNKIIVEWRAENNEPSKTYTGTQYMYDLGKILGEMISEDGNI